MRRAFRLGLQIATAQDSLSGIQAVTMYNAVGIDGIPPPVTRVPEFTHMAPAKLDPSGVVPVPGHPIT